MKKLILASNSQIRKDLLLKTGFTFSVISPKVNEDLIKSSLKDPTPTDISEVCAIEKALSISKEYPNALVIGADQVCSYKNQMFSKPLSKEKAIIQLSQLNGKTHQLISGLCIANNNKIIWKHIETLNLTMKKLTSEEIETYINNDLPLYSCGSYKYESMGKELFSNVSGSSDAIQGLPLTPLKDALNRFN